MYVYLIKTIEDNKYKIGKTNNINKRLKELQTGNSNELILVDSYYSKYSSKVESALHNFFKHKNIINEWFEFDQDDINKFKQLCKQTEENLIFLEKNLI